MTRSLSLFAAVAVVLSLAFVTIANEPASSTAPVTVQPTVVPHCQVPCGIYGDQMRFEGMLEDTKTIAKAIDQIQEFSKGLGGGAPTATAINQSSRWVANKESHATNIQDVMAQYFFAQRIKADHKDYTGQLATAHKVIVAAMKCKQDANPATAEGLKKAILDFYTAYEGKEPTFHNEEGK